MLKNYYNKHLGEPCLIVGCGPSMTDKLARDLMARGVTTIGVNHCFMYDDYNFRPTYHFFSDYATEFAYVNQEVLKEISEKGTMMCFPDKLHPKYQEGLTNTLKYSLFEGTSKYNFRIYNEKPDIVHFSRGQTVVYTALQFAAFLGFNPICLVGVDFTLTKDKRMHNYDTHSLHKKAAKKMQDVAFPFRKEHIAITAAPALLRAGITVFNLSKISTLDCFPKPSGKILDVLDVASYA